MTKEGKDTLGQVAFTHFVPSLFIGIVQLFLLDALYSEKTVAVLADDVFTIIDLTVSAINGVLVATLVVVYHLSRNRRLKRIRAISRVPASTQKIIYAGFIGFLGGAADVSLALNNMGLPVLTGIVLILLIMHIRAFSRKMVAMLRPDNIATWGDVSELLRIYLTMLAGFTLVNATLEGMHIMAQTPAPFGFMNNGGDIFLNSLYYTVVTMTTLGFGDIVPQTWDAKLFLIFQCLASYFMFALVVGIITRGVVQSKEKTTPPKRLP